MPYLFRTQTVSVAMCIQTANGPPIQTGLRNIQLVYRRPNVSSNQQEQIIAQADNLDDAGIANFKLDAKRTYGLK